MSIVTELKYTANLDKGVCMTPITPAFMGGDQEAHRITIDCYRQNSREPVDLSGAGVTAYFVRADGTTIPLAGETNGSKASVLLPAACYAVMGRFSLVIKLSMDDGTADSISTVFWGEGAVSRSRTDVVIDPDSVIPSLEELLAQIAAMEIATNNANTAAENANQAAADAMKNVDEAVARQDETISQLYEDKVDKNGVGQIAPLNIEGVTISGNLFPVAVTLIAENTYAAPVEGKVVYTSSAYYNAYKMHAFKAGVIYSATALRFLLFVDADGNVEKSYDSAEQFVPTETTNEIIFSVNKGTYSLDTFVLCEGESLVHDTTYIAPAWLTDGKPFKKPFASVEGDMSDGTVLKDTVPVLSTHKDERLVFNADIDTMGTVEIGLSRYTSCAESYRMLRVIVDATHIKTKSVYGEIKSYEHGLSIANNIQILVEEQADDTSKVTLHSNGATYSVPTNENWNKYGRYFPFAVSTGSVLTNCKLTWSNSALSEDIWIIGDSYCSYAWERWRYEINRLGYNNFLVGAYAGCNSENALENLKVLLKYGTPKMLVWSLGMNDGADGDTYATEWKTALDAVVALCEDNNIVLILATIPSIPSKSHEHKNAYVRSSGYRYIDYAKAVGASANGEWYSGMISSDAIHTTHAGAVAMANRLLLDLPEIMVK